MGVRKNDVALQENCNTILIEEVDQPMFALLRPLVKTVRKHESWGIITNLSDKYKPLGE